jgi:hypothetical protein
MHLVANTDSCAPVLIRKGKVYIFIVGLVGLSSGLEPVVDAYVRNLPGALLFWLNTISAVVDNATLAAVEIGPALSRNQQRFAMLGLLIIGGMLILGNIPNIVAASRLESSVANGPHMSSAPECYCSSCVSESCVLWVLSSGPGQWRGSFMAASLLVRSATKWRRSPWRISTNEFPTLLWIR